MRNTKTILAIFCSMLVLSTSMGAVVYQHYCGDMVKEVSLAKIDKHCADHQDAQSCHHPSSKKDCCKTEKKAISTSDKQVKQADEVKTVNKGAQFVTVFYVLVQYLFTNPFEGGERQTSIQDNAGPPLANQSIVISNQSFLI